MGAFLDKTTVGLIAITAVLIIISIQKTGVFPWSATGRAGSMFIAIFPKLIFGFLIGAILPDILPENVMKSWFSDSSGWKGILIGWLVGAVAPIGAPIILYPMMAGLLAGGAGIGPIVTMFTSAALFGPWRIIVLETPILGVDFFFLRFISVFWVPPVAGFLARAASIYMR